MAQKRMFSLQIVDSDAFLDMPISTQALYFHLGMRADDDGFLNNAKRIMRTVGASDDDLKLLAAKRFIIVMESGVIVIKHWLINNSLRSDRRKDTVYQEEKSMLTVRENGVYSVNNVNSGCQLVADRLTDGIHSIGKVSIDKDSIAVGKVETVSDPYRRYRTAVDNDVIIWAQQEAERSGHGDNRKYVCAILDRLTGQGITTLERVLESERMRKASRQAPSAHGYQEHSYTDSDFGDDFYFVPGGDNG